MLHSMAFRKTDMIEYWGLSITKFYMVVTSVNQAKLDKANYIKV